MKTNNVIEFIFEKEDRIYRLIMPHGAPLGEAYEATSNFLTEMVRMINEHAKKSLPKDAADDSSDKDSEESSEEEK